MDDDQQISGLTGEFCQPTLERGYRTHQASAELRQLRLLWGAALICFVAYLPVEALVLDGWPPWAQLWPRLAILASGALVLLLVRQPLLIRWRDWISSAGLLAALVCYGNLLAARGSSGSGALLLLLLGAYLFSPCRFSLQCLAGLAGSLFAATLASRATTLLELSYLLPANLLAGLALAQFNRSQRRLFLRERRLARLHHRNRSLLYNALPKRVAQQLRDNPRRRPVRFEPAVTVLFADIVGFSTLTRQLAPAQLLALLDALFLAFDRAAERYRLEKIKTIGDAYLAVAGLSQGERGCAVRAAAMSKAMHMAAAAVGARFQLPLSLRIGLHTGPVVAGVLGSKRYAFDIWGDTVNVASRLQAEAEEGGTLVSEAVRLAAQGRLQVGDDRHLVLRGCGAIVAGPLVSVSARAPTPQSTSPLPRQPVPHRKG